MPTFKSFNQIVASMLERISFTQPNLDTKPGTVSRDVFIDLPADQLEKLYKVISIVADKQSPETAGGSDLDRYASNFGISRTQGSVASGIVVFTTNSIVEDIPIPAGSLVTAKNGLTYSIVGSYILQASSKSKYSATANRLKRSLQVAGINDPYAIEVPVQATRSGTTGNVSSLQILNHNLQSDLKVVNLSSMSGGSNQESDGTFRTRIASVFSGSNTGTALGYRNAALAVNGVLDALIVEPGNSLMLRDGTETIKVNDGTFRILNSGTGGKVDIYILGKSLKEVSESFIFRDLSGSGNVKDERNDFILGSTAIDLTRTAQERRYLAFKNGILPTQPAYSISSVYGSESGLLSESSTDLSGIISGNYELIKDYNPDTGGSPFSFDKIHFISSEKKVTGESVIKQGLNSVDQVSSSDISKINEIYRDLSISEENSKSLQSDKTYISLLHKPVVNVSRIQNKTTGETYTVESQELDSITGLNESGLIKISGKILPNQSDILSVDYVWRQIFDKYVDYNGFSSNSIFYDPNISDVINWGVSNGIREEESIITSEDENATFKVEVSNNISKVVSVKIQETEELIVSAITNIETGSSLGVIVTNSSEVLNINSITTINGLELYNTKNNNGDFSGQTIYLPTDTPAILGQTIYVKYNYYEIYNIDNTDASFSDNIITLPSSDVLLENDILDLVINSSNLETTIYIDYIEERSQILPSTPLSSLPLIGNNQSNNLFNSNSTNIEESIQPIAFVYDDNSLVQSILRNSPSNFAINITNSSSAGRLKIVGTSYNKCSFSGNFGTIFTGLKANLKNNIIEFFKLNEINADYFISRVNEVYTIDDQGNKDIVFDLNGYSIAKNSFDLFSAIEDLTLKNYEFSLPSNSNNNGISLSSGTTIYIECIISKLSDMEDIYFATNKTMYTSKSYARIDRMTVSSGFRSSTGSVTGNMVISFANQPSANIPYFANYSFSSPKEGERITIRYNINQLLLDVTNSIENFRPITADVLVKEAEEIKIDVGGVILINENRLDAADSILEDASNAISSLLSTNTLGPTIDYSDVIAAVVGINGIDSVNISLFNVSGEVGRKSFIKALDNQTINPGTITLEAVSRKNFRIS
jgi:uncharacterized phage protein gp47/JayE